MDRLIITAGSLAEAKAALALARTHGAPLLARSLLRSVQWLIGLHLASSLSRTATSLPIPTPS